MTEAERRQILRDVDNVYDEEQFGSALKKLHKESTQEDLPWLMTLLEHPDINLREGAAWPISELAGLAALPDLFRAYQRGFDEGHDNDGFTAALNELVDADKAAARQALAEILESGDPALRENAAWLLQSCNGEVVSSLGNTPAKGPPRVMDVAQTPSGRCRPLWRDALLFVACTASVFALGDLSTPWFGGRTQEALRALGIPTQTNGFQFLFSHLFALSFVPGAINGGILAYLSKRRVLEFVWVVPTVVLLYQLVTFPTAHSVLGPTPSDGPWKYYFGGDFPDLSFGSWDEFGELMRTPDFRRGMNQVRYTASFYSGIGYSGAAWIYRRFIRRSSPNSAQ